MTTFLPTPTSALDIPDTPDLERMRRETGARLRSAMADRGVDALILLGNNSVVYATGVSWPLGDAGLSYVERPVAVVLADDPHPHLFLPFREGAASESGLPADHLHGPVYLEFDEGVENFAQVIEDLVPAAAVVAVDELTGAMRRAQPRLFRSGRPADAAQIVGAAKLIKTPDELACIRTAVRITDTAMVDVQAALAPGIRQIDLSAKFTRRTFELGAMASMLEPIWQVMPKT
jgi:Xaa-Pro aminopeptidase